MWNERRTKAIGTDVYWEAFLEKLASKDLPKASDEEQKAFWGRMKNLSNNYAVMLANDVFANGPSLERTWTHHRGTFPTG